MWLSFTVIAFVVQTQELAVQLERLGESSLRAFKVDIPTESTFKHDEKDARYISFVHAFNGALPW